MTLLTEPTRIVLAKGQPVPNDPNFAFNSLLLHGNGTNGSTVITDSSGSPKTVTAVGNAQISTAQSKFGGSSLYQAAAHTDLFNFTNFGSNLEFPGDYTIEGWVYYTALGGDSSFFVISNPAPNAYFAFNIDSSNFNLYFNSAGLVVLGPHGMSLNTWHHVAMCRTGSSVKVFTDGIQRGADITSATTHGYTTFGLSRIGGGAAGSARYIDEFRITKGVARYTANFTPPTAPFPDF